MMQMMPGNPGCAPQNSLKILEFWAVCLLFCTRIYMSLHTQPARSALVGRMTQSPKGRTSISHSIQWHFLVPVSVMSDVTFLPLPTPV